MSTTDLLDLALTSRFDAKQQPNSQTWRASSTGFCPRGQFLERLGVPKTRVMPAKEIRTLEWGNAIHDFCKGLLRETGCLVEPKEPMNLCPGCRDDEWHLEDPELNASCHLDALLTPHPELVKDGDSRLAHLRYEVTKLHLDRPFDGPRVVEIKGLKSSAMVRMVREAKSKGPEHLFQDHHLYQAGAQALLVKRNPSLLPVEVDAFELLAVGKDAFGYLSFDLPDKWVKKAEDWIGELNQAWSEKKLPECGCSGWRRTYCSFPDGQGGCCSEDLASAA